MKYSFILILIIAACTSQSKSEGKPFPVLTVTDDEWATYEGSWLAPDGAIKFELSLKSGAVGYDSYYKLYEHFESDRMASGNSSYGVYSTEYDLINKEVRIRLQNLGQYKKGIYLRHANSDGEEEMFFVSRGKDELLPCDNIYKPVTEDKRYTLHKRSRLFTVEGYFSFEQDSAFFFERKTMERWNVAMLGEFDEMKRQYFQKASQPFEGVYVKALTYSVSDSTSLNEQGALVLKRIADIGNDPD
jgi:hypothetical protein